MLLDEILEDLQLTHKNNHVTFKSACNLHSSGQCTLDMLSSAAREKYHRFLGSTSYVCNLPSMPEYLKLAAFEENIKPNKYTRRMQLTSGNDSWYAGDASAADYALACDLLQSNFSVADTEIIMRTTRYREKFDEMRGSTTYLERTLNNAHGNIAQDEGKPVSEQHTLFYERGRISIPATPPAPRDYVWQGRMVAGHAYVLGGFGGVSKSQAALQFAASVAMGIPFGNIATKRGCALVLCGEDDSSEIERRLGAYAVQENLTPNQHNELEKNICAFGLVGADSRLTTIRNGALESTAFASEIIAASIVLTEQSGQPLRLIVLDHAGLFHGGDFNAREDVSLTMRIVNHIANKTCAAVLLLAHSPKAAGVSETSDTSAIAGSTAFVDQTRGAFILATMRPNEAKALGVTNDQRQEYVSLAVVKNNYGRTGEASWFTRISPPDWEVGVLVPVNLQPPEKNVPHSSAVSDRVKQFVANHPGQYSKNSLREKRSGKTGELKASKPEVAAAIEDLLAAGELITREPTLEERRKFDLPQQTKVVLDVPANGM